MQTAIDTAFALDPIPNPTNIALVTAAQGGSFSQGFVLQDSIQFVGDDVTILGSDSVIVTLASFLSCRITTVINFLPSGIGYKIDGEVSVGINSSVVGAFGEDGIGLNITGDCNNLFITISQVDLRGLNSIGINITSDCDSVDDFNINTVTMNAEGCTFIDYNPVTTSDVANINVSTVETGNGITTGTAFDLDNGILVVQAGVINTPTFAVLDNQAQLTIRAQTISGDLILNEGSACTIKSVAFYVGDIDVNNIATLFMDAQILSGNIDMAASTNGVVNIGFMTGDVINSGTLFLEIEALQGDITVASGATLNCDIASHVGTLTYDGTINGIINGVRYGTYTEQILIVGDSAVDQIPTGTDAPLQIEFGAAQGSGSDPVQLALDGTITANVKGQYIFKFGLQYGRTGAGGVSLLLFRLLINGVQLRKTRLSALDTSNEDLPFVDDVFIDLESGDEVTVEIVRDSLGNDSGQLLAFNPSLAGVADVPSASLVVSR